MSNIKVLDKTFQILNSFDDANKSVSLKELSSTTKLNKSTILRICNSLIKYNFLIKNEINGSYRLGPGSWKLGSIYNSNFKSGEEIRSILNRILESTGQSAGYWVKAGSKKVCLYRVNSKSELNHYVVEGTTFELKSATGKVIKAFTQNDQDLKNLINKKGYISISKFMEISLTDPEEGYYINQKPLGKSGDFITAPEITQIFGEVIGALAIDLSLIHI